MGLEAVGTDRYAVCWTDMCIMRPQAIKASGLFLRSADTARCAYTQKSSTYLMERLHFVPMLQQYDEWTRHATI